MTAITKRALITGITGQDGSYLTEFLLEKGYEVHGIIRRTSTFNTDRIDHFYVDPHYAEARMFLHYGDLTDGTTMRRLLEEIEPAEVYNLGAQSHVRVSFDSPEYNRRYGGNGYASFVRGYPRLSAPYQPRNPVLSSRFVRDVRQGAGYSPKRDNALLSAQPLRLR